MTDRMRAVCLTSDVIFVTVVMEPRAFTSKIIVLYYFQACSKHILGVIFTASSKFI